MKELLTLPDITIAVNPAHTRRPLNGNDRRLNRTPLKVVVGVQPAKPLPASELKSFVQRMRLATVRLRDEADTSRVQELHCAVRRASVHNQVLNMPISLVSDAINAAGKQLAGLQARRHNRDERPRLHRPSALPPGSSPGPSAEHAGANAQDNSTPNSQTARTSPTTCPTAPTIPSPRNSSLLFLGHWNFTEKYKTCQARPTPAWLTACTPYRTCPPPNFTRRVNRVLPATSAPAAAPRVCDVGTDSNNSATPPQRRIP